jgi:hypothetical protein
MSLLIGLWTGCCGGLNPLKVPPAIVYVDSETDKVIGEEIENGKIDKH